ncbi:hypothetical protein COBT_002640, partial [Conglomerata obtusa]
NVLIPRLTYGCEILGMSNARTSALKRIIDDAFKCIVKKANYNRKRVYEEFDILPLNVLTAAQKMRAIKKWENSPKIIGSLIRSHTNFASKQRPWIKNCSIWVKTNKIDTNQSIQNCIKSLINIRMTKIKNLDRSIIGEWGRKLKISSGNILRKMEITKECNNRGINTLLQIRTGTFKYTNHLVKIGKLPEYYYNTCILCRENKIENAYHLLIECTALIDIREYIFKNFFVSQNVSELNKLKIQSTLLGGEQHAFSGKRTKILLRSCKYLGFVTIRRHAMLSQHFSLFQ